MSQATPSSTTARRGRPPAANPPEQRVEAVERALSILDAFTAAEPRLALSELARRTGLYPSTLLRLAASLERCGHLARGEDGLFRLGPACLRLGMAYRDGFDLAAHIRPALSRLVEQTGETAAFYVREGRRRIVLFRQESARGIRHALAEGDALLLERGAAGRVLLAHAGGPPLRQGHALSLGERDPELAAIAAAVLGAGGRLLGALSISGPIGRFRGAARGTLVAAVTTEAARLSASFGAQA
ncbi:MAG: IclR family transcriptional regulator [Alphaproteobacteria bacterium]|nr:IclR family transcriptional regulator [Alphaproteobacteria bacterium]